MDMINKKIDDVILKYGLDRYYPLFREKRSGKANTGMGDYSNLVSWQDNFCCVIDGIQNSQSLRERADLTVMEIDRLLIGLETETDMVKRKEYLERLVFLSIYKRNFLLAREMVQCLLTEFPTMKEYEKAWNEVHDLVESVKEKIKSRRTRDIIGIWLDAVSYMDMHEIPYLLKCSEGEHTVSFTQAYTVTPNTNPTFALILTGKRRIDESSYLIKKIDGNNSEVIALLEDTGHICRFIGSYWKQIDDSYRSGVAHYIFAPCSEMLWDMVCNLLETEGKVFLLTHVFPELHTPYVSMNQRQISDCTERMRRLRGRQEVDRQLSYYMDFVGAAAVQIFFSDHGDNWQSKDVFHTVLEVCHKDYRKDQIDGVFSYKNFPKLLKHIIAAPSIDKEQLISDYAEIQDIPIYDKRLIYTMLKDKWWLFSNQLWGYRGVIDCKFIYICHKKTDGCIEETLMENKRGVRDKFCNLFFPGYSPIIDEEAVLRYRTIVKSKEKECVDEEKLKYSRYLQKVAQNAMPMHDKKMKLVGRLFCSLPNHGIAFRGGGLDTGRILYFYRKELGGVEYIIDSNKNCLCAVYGIPIISIEEVPQKPIHTVIFASKKFMEEFRKEVSRYPVHIRIVDIYQYLSDNGITEDAPFYYFQPQEKDYDVGFPVDDER